MPLVVPPTQGHELASGIPPVLPGGKVQRFMRPSRGKSPGDDTGAGRRKRRRLAVPRQWQEGDHVDAWVDDG